VGSCFGANTIVTYTAPNNGLLFIPTTTWRTNYQTIGVALQHFPRAASWSSTMPFDGTNYSTIGDYSGTQPRLILTATPTRHFLISTHMVTFFLHCSDSFFPADGLEYFPGAAPVYLNLQSSDTALPYDVTIWQISTSPSRPPIFSHQHPQLNHRHCLRVTDFFTSTSSKPVLSEMGTVTNDRQPFNQKTHSPLFWVRPRDWQRLKPLLTLITAWVLRALHPRLPPAVPEKPSTLHLRPWFGSPLYARTSWPLLRL